MEQHKEGTNENTFKNFGKRVDDFMAEVNEAGGKLQKEFQEKIEDLKVAAGKLKNEAESSERWKEVETSLKRAGDEFSKAFKSAFKKNN